MYISMYSTVSCRGYSDLDSRDNTKKGQCELEFERVQSLTGGPSASDIKIKTEDNVAQHNHSPNFQFPIVH